MASVKVRCCCAMARKMWNFQEYRQWQWVEELKKWVYEMVLFGFGHCSKAARRERTHEQSFFKLVSSIGKRH